MSYYTRERIGPKQSMTPEGFLLCEDVPIARTGEMLYGPGEVPVEPGPDGTIIITRTPEEVFRKETLDSFNGKPLVNGHPDEDVHPLNWRSLSSGVVLNPRRGTGAQDDLMLADILVTYHDEIEAIKLGLREVSAGYDAKYISIQDASGNDIPGRARQVTIVGNHVALVEAGRCGPRCAIGDQQFVRTGDNAMTWLETLKAAWGAKDQAAFDAALADAPTGNVSLTTDQLRTIAKLTRDAKDCDCGKADCKECGKTKDAKALDAIAKDVKDIGDKVTSLDTRMKKMEDAESEEDDEEEKKKKKTEDDENRKIEGNLEEEAPPGTGDGVAAKAKDSIFLVDSFQEAVALAEIIAPGVGIPTVDAKATPRKTLDSLCGFRKTVLDLAYAQPETRTFIDGITGGRDFKTYDCSRMRTLYNAVGAFKKKENNNHTEDHLPQLVTSGGGLGSMLTPADINKRNAEMWKQN